MTVMSFCAVAPSCPSCACIWIFPLAAMSWKVSLTLAPVMNRLIDSSALWIYLFPLAWLLNGHHDALRAIRSASTSSPPWFHARTESPGRCG